jgi:hypothetical protein
MGQRALPLLAEGYHPSRGDVKVQKVSYLNQPNCYRLANDSVELIVTTDVGPRIIRYGFLGRDNVLAEVPELATQTAFGEFKPWGGHRLWAAPEANPRSYVPDNNSLASKIEADNKIRLMPATERETGIGKEMTVSLASGGTCVTVQHRIFNRNQWAIDLAPWALTIMNGGGEAIFPQEPYRSWDDYLLPARPLVLWHYTDLSDPRWTLSQKYLRLRTDERLAGPQKAGIANKQGWAAYLRQGTLFVKRFDYQEGATYPDYGSNNETYTAGTFIEIESLGPLQRLEPGEGAEHTERWYLFDNVNAGETEASLEAAITPLVEQTAGE